MGLGMRKPVFGVSGLASMLLNFFHAQLSMKFHLLTKKKYRKINMFLALKLSNNAFIMLINVKMPTIVGIYEHNKF